ncbi:S-layer homology domain-containing protein [Paenibacillus sp. GXUN7292]|uniref:S-layer homology domain-containing protein n=1 Tax=Paenibacillus sp. GXUN7292 TaxID=3422499 RepID=UPI003D7CDA5C
MKSMLWRKLALVATSFVVAAVMLLGAASHEVKAASNSVFSDVKGHWAEKSILEMYDRGIVSGFPDGTFRPDDRVNIDQFVKMLVASLAEKRPSGKYSWKEGFTDRLSVYQKNDLLRTGFDLNDLPRSAYWAEPYLQFADAMNLIDRDERLYGGKFDRPMTREIASLTIRGTLDLLEYPESTRYALLGLDGITDHHNIDEDLKYSVGSAIVKGMLVGYPDGSFRPKGFITRAEAVVIIDRIWNEGLRKPYLPDLSNQFSTIETLFDGQKRYVVFEKKEFVEVAEAVGQAALKSRGYAEFDGKFAELFDSKETKMVYLERQNSDPYFFETAPYDFEFGITASENSYVFAARDYDLNESVHKEAVNHYLNKMFGNDADKFKDKFFSFAEKHATGKRPSPEDYVFNGRDVRLMMDTPTSVVAHISVQRR